MAGGIYPRRGRGSLLLSGALTGRRREHNLPCSMKVTGLKELRESSGQPKQMWPQRDRVPRTEFTGWAAGRAFPFWSQDCSV